ncbi:MAG: SPASM domain-containing protein, partial [Candidatus Margulisbacteria bacterium]|nr:SPASM domain-containing protein [Candidatus Margulisiibacteriota bacterium]
LSYGGIMSNSYLSNNRCKVMSSRNVNISWDGDCSPCNLDVNLALKGGNLLMSRDIKEITSSISWHKVRSLITQKKSICASCFDANNYTKNKFYYAF